MRSRIRTVVVRRRSPSSPAPFPPTTSQTSRTWVPSRRDSPRSPGVAMVPAHRTPSPDCPAAAFATGQAYSAAGLIPSRLSWVWTCPPLACCHRLLPHPCPRHPAPRCQTPTRASPAAPWQRHVQKGARFRGRVESGSRSG